MEMEEGYRRGTVLGLTIAEIFILLVFLMLLALMGVNRYWSDKIDPWKDIMAKTTPEEIEVALGQPEQLRRKIERLNRQIEELEKEKKRLQSRIRALEGQGRETGEKLDEANRKLREAMRALAECEKALADADRQIETLTIENDRLRDTNRELRGENDTLGERIRIIGKGVTAPCWYQQIEETNPITKANWREKTYYLFDIAIRDDHMEVQRLPIPKGSAEDDHGMSYLEEAKGLALDTIPYGKSLTDEQMRNVMRHLYEKGKASQIRTYSCVFYVRVWDETHSEAKKRWKQALALLQQLFGTHQVRGTSWKDRHEEPVNVLISSRRAAP